MPGIDTPASPPVDTLSSKGTPLPTLPKGPPTVAPARPASPAMQKAREALRGKATPDGADPQPSKVEPPTPTPAPAKADAKATEPPAKASGEPQDASKPAGEGQDTPKAGEAPGDGKQPGKQQSPWKLVEAYKAKLANTERELAEARVKGNPADVDALKQKLEAAEKRAQSYEEEMRYIDYSKSEEFKEKYVKPYDDAWSRAAAELEELTIATPEGGTRQATVKDLLNLAQLPLGEARRMANELFGDAADDVMAHRRTIRELAAAQDKALADAKKNGNERQQQQAEALNKVRTEGQQLWAQILAEEEGKRDFLQAKEDDNEWNEKLEKAKLFVDGALSKNAFDPKLTPQERAEAVKRHVALRNRAIGFAVRGLEIKRLRADLKSANDELAKFKSSTPTTGGGKPGAADGTASMDPMQRSLAALRARATPG